MIQHEAAAPMSVDVVDGSPTSTTVERDRAAEKHARTAAIGSLDELESACRAVATELTELTEGEAKTPESIIGLQNQRQNLYACLVVEIVWNDLTEEFHVPQSLSTACTAAVAELRAFQKKLAGRIQEYWKSCARKTSCAGQRRAKMIKLVGDTVKATSWNAIQAATNEMQVCVRLCSQMLESHRKKLSEEAHKKADWAAMTHEQQQQKFAILSPEEKAVMLQGMTPRQRASIGNPSGVADWLTLNWCCESRNPVQSSMQSYTAGLM